MLQERMAGTGTASLDIYLADELVQLGEEEQFARDLYAAFFAKWGVQVFYTLVEEEGRHLAAIRSFLDRNGVRHSLGSGHPGVLNDAAAQTRYDELVAIGSRSLEDAYGVGIAIERAEIALLSSLVTNETRPDVMVVARHLRADDYNHLAILSFLGGK